MSKDNLSATEIEDLKAIAEQREKLLAVTYCDYKWHYKNHEEFHKAFDNDEFGLTTMVSFYTNYIILTNNYDYPERLPKNVSTCMEISWDDWVAIRNNNEITSFWDWETAEEAI